MVAETSRILLIRKQSYKSKNFMRIKITTVKYIYLFLFVIVVDVNVLKRKGFNLTAC